MGNMTVVLKRDRDSSFLNSFLEGWGAPGHTMKPECKRHKQKDIRLTLQFGGALALRLEVGAAARGEGTASVVGYLLEKTDTSLSQ